CEPLASGVRFHRGFGKPRQLDPHEVVWLTFRGVDTVAVLTLNGCFLGRNERAGEPFEFDVTALLGERNELVVELEVPPDKGATWGAVALEVRARAFLRGLRVGRECSDGTARLHVRGEAVGVSERALDLYVLMNRSTVAYRTVQPTPGGQPFEIVLDGVF